MNKKTRPLLAATLVGALALSLAACGGTNKSTSGSASGSGGKTVVIDTTFDLKTADPGREYEPTGELVGKALYDTLVTFNDNDTTKTVPDLATMQESQDLKTFTFTMVPGRVFSDGTPVTADDVVFSLQRLQGLKGNPSFLLDGVTVTKIDDKTVQLTTTDPAPALPAILADPSCGILNKAVVVKNGGTTDSTDKAEKYLNTASAGSGPYMIKSLDVATKVTLVKNPKYNGTEKPTYNTVVLRNVVGSTQAMNVQRGDSQVALDLSGEQAKSVGSKVKVESVPSGYTIFLLVNQDPSVSKTTSDPNFLKAVKLGVDYSGIVSVAGPGAIQATGLIPSQFLGTLSATDELKFDSAAAKAALAQVATKGAVTLSYPNDVNLGGLEFQTVAEKIQAQLKTIGITVNLAPQPVAVELDAYRNGKEQMGLWYWGPDYMDPAGYLPFSPGQSVGLRAGWKTGADSTVEQLAQQALTTSAQADRQTIFQQWGKAMLQDGPFVPLLQPPSNIAHDPSVTNVTFNPVWILNVAAIGSK
ncbi:MAG: ABC transporter substrate-binding protein [Bifidobacteriaceae bacterium]|nr:ABC transporter substrate-binding protein [Bifidobacteriaceae bacterium]